MRRLFFLFLLLSLAGCRSYDFAKNGFIVQGDDQFVSLDNRLTIYVGCDFLEQTAWKQGVSPMQIALSTKSKKLLKKLGYPKKAYTVLFDSQVANKDRSYSLVTVVNKLGVQQLGNDDLIDINTLKRKETAKGRWFYEYFTVGRSLVYHAVIPVSDKLWSEKYVSMIYIFSSDDKQHLAYVESLVEANVVAPLLSSAFFPVIKVSDCTGMSEEIFYDYTIPQSFVNPNNYMILKVVRDGASSEELISYTLLEPNVGLGSLRICKGSYRMQYTTLQGEVIWEKVIAAENTK